MSDTSAIATFLTWLMALPIDPASRSAIKKAHRGLKNTHNRIVGHFEDKKAHQDYVDALRRLNRSHWVMGVQSPLVEHVGEIADIVYRPFNNSMMVFTPETVGRVYPEATSWDIAYLALSETRVLQSMHEMGFPVPKPRNVVGIYPPSEEFTSLPFIPDSLPFNIVNETGDNFFTNGNGSSSSDFPPNHFVITTERCVGPRVYNTSPSLEQLGRLQEVRAKLVEIGIEPGYLGATPATCFSPGADENGDLIIDRGSQIPQLEGSGKIVDERFDHYDMQPLIVGTHNWDIFDPNSCLEVQLARVYARVELELAFEGVEPDYRIPHIESTAYSAAM